MVRLCNGCPTGVVKTQAVGPLIETSAEQNIGQICVVKIGLWVLDQNIGRSKHRIDMYCENLGG